MNRPILGLSLVLLLAMSLLIFLYLPYEPEPTEEAVTVRATPLPSQKIPEGFLILDESTGEILEIGTEEFVTAALALEMSPDAPKEALKAQAIAIRSYYERLRHQYIGEEFHFSCNSEKGLVFADRAYFKELWGDELENNMEIISEAVKETEGQLLRYGDEIACAAFHPISSGTTAPGEGFPYLMSVASPYDSLSPYFEDEKRFSPDEVVEICRETWPEGRFNFELPHEEWFRDIVFSTGTVVYSTNICGFGVTGQEVREAFGLQSTAFRSNSRRMFSSFTHEG